MTEGSRFGKASLPRLFSLAVVLSFHFHHEAGYSFHAGKSSFSLRRAEVILKLDNMKSTPGATDKETGATRNAARGARLPSLNGVLYFAVGIANSAPFSVLSGQRCMMDFCFV